MADSSRCWSRRAEYSARASWRKNCRSDRRYIVLKREVPEAAADALRAKLRAQNLRGIYFERDSTRLYPNGSMLCHVIGFTDFEHHGIQGVEASMDEYLHGAGWLSLHRARSRRPGDRALSRAGTRAAQWLPGSSHDRSESAEHRRERNRRGHARIFAEKSHHHPDAAADRRDPGDGEPAELRSQPARRTQSRSR